MRLATALVNHCSQGVIIAADDTAHPIGDLVGGPPLQVIDIIRNAKLAEHLETVVGNLGNGLPIKSLTLVAPIPDPIRNIFCVGWNYLPHYVEGHAHRNYEVPTVPEHPAFFTKQPSTVIGPDGGVLYPTPHSTELDWEGELAVIIGTPGRDIPANEASEHVFGFTIANDISVRDFQKRHGNQWFKGKSFDTHCPIGPWIVTARDIINPAELDLRVTVNDELKQHASTSDMIFSVEQLIAELSIGMKLQAGDIILTGTPAGVGATASPPSFLSPGDRVSVSISGIGVLSSTVVAQQ